MPFSQGFICPSCGDQTEVVSVAGKSQCSECQQPIETYSGGDSLEITGELNPCKCGGKCGCGGKCKRSKRTLALVGIPANWHCIKCGKQVEAPSK